MLKLLNILVKEKEISNLDDSFASDDSEDDIEDFKPTTR